MTAPSVTARTTEGTAGPQTTAGVMSIGVALGSNLVDPWETLAPAAGMRDSLRDHLGCYSVPLATDDESPSGLALQAARRALASSGVGPDEVDMVISNNITSDYLDWQMSGYLADQLGIDAVTTFDVYAGCNSTGVAFQTALAVIEADPAVDTVLIALAEHLGGGTFPQFIGDGGCAWVVRRDHPELTVVGSHNVNDVMPRLGVLPEGGVVNPFTPETRFDGEWQDNVDFSMDAYRKELKPIFVPMCANPYRELCEKQGVAVEETDRLYIVHQQRDFNARLVDHLGLPADRTPLHHIGDTGHISGFDVFLSLKRELDDGTLAKGALVGLLIVGLGEVHTFLIRY